ncbi:M15 family metallopeptidase [Bradyrhizobium liaoningense]|uniref:M15 family metallopeptidase n=1 Tax=Bradyrhizobium liaoningense TaxID=43992 RepID=UPI001BA4CD3B|nr:M15 family metallopeptidase [Bradyrhizobium liaoningense]MBR0901205.1 M15 family metallopeptidase [Bradyrhizobium liaoningense]
MADDTNPYSLVSPSTSPADFRRKLGLALVQKGVDTSPIASPWQGAARIAQALVGGAMERQANADAQDAQEAYIQAALSTQRPAIVAALAGQAASAGPKVSDVIPNDSNATPGTVGMNTKLANAIDDFIDDNPGTSLSSGVRTTQKQAQLYANRGSNPNPVAPPGTSLHERGMAADIAGMTPAQRAMLPQYGLAQPVANDPVHVELARDPSALPMNSQPTQGTLSSGVAQAAPSMTPEMAAALHNPNIPFAQKAMLLSQMKPEERQFVQTSDGAVLSLGKRGGTPQVVYQAAEKPQVINNKLVTRDGRVIGDFSDSNYLLHDDPNSGRIWAINKNDPKDARLIGGGDNTAPQGNPYAPGPGKITKEQADAANYANRMVASHNIIGQFSPSPNESWGQMGQRLWDSAMTSAGTPGKVLPGLPTNGLMSDARQQMEQAKRDFINAVLRRESGAAIADSEFASADRQYFPQVGDGEDVIRQKAANRERAIEGIMGGAGPTYRPPAEYKASRNADAGWHDMGNGVRIREKR